MVNPSLVVMAAGIGSRFQGGLKQLTKMGPNGEIILDYSISDAISNGFSKVVFIIRKEIEKDFREIIGKRIEAKVNVEYVYQDINNIPSAYLDYVNGRTKPWGTGHAILSAKDVVNEPFMVINADDYYGSSIYKLMYDYLQNNNDDTRYALAGYHLKNTLSKNGTVTRGVCNTTDDDYLISIHESYNLLQKGDEVCGELHGINNEITPVTYPLSAITSMNMWGIYPNFFDKLEEEQDKFFSEISKDDKKAEFLLPQVIDNELQANNIKVKIIETTDKWFGVTYSSDIEYVQSKMLELSKLDNYKGIV